MKRWIAIPLAAMLVSAPVAARADGATFGGFPVVNVSVNGQPLQSDVPPIIVGGRTMLPVRAVADAVGAGVSWDAATRTVGLTTKGGHLAWSVPMTQNGTGPNHYNLTVPCQIGGWMGDCIVDTGTSNGVSISPQVAQAAGPALTITGSSTVQTNAGNTTEQVGTVPVSIGLSALAPEVATVGPSPWPALIGLQTLLDECQGGALALSFLAGRTQLACVTN